MFKTKKYLNNRKVAEAVNRILSRKRSSVVIQYSVDPLFYLSSFQNPFAEIPGVWSQPPGIFPLPSGNRQYEPRLRLSSGTIGSPGSTVQQEMKMQLRDIP